MPTSSTSYNNSKAYTNTVTGYDTAGRPTGSSVTIPAGEGNLTGTYAFGVTYDTAGRVATATYPQAGNLAAETVTSNYDALGLPTTLTGTINGVAKPYVTATGFSQLGQLANRTYGGGTAGQARRTFTYEADTGRLATVTAKSGTALTTVQDDRYTYDAIGNATRVAEHNAAGSLAVAECFAYDKLNRLTQAFTTTAAACAANPAAGSANGVEPYHLSWAYDDIGNRLTETNKLTTLPSTRTSAYPTSGDGVDRPHAPTKVTTSGDPSQATVTYDDAGNTDVRTIDGLTGDFTWDVFGRLDHVDTQHTSGGSTVTEQTGYVYDADGNRLLRREKDTTTLYLGGMELALTTDGPGTGAVEGTRYYSHGGAPVAVRTTTALTWMLNDGQSSAEISVDAATGTTSRRRYLPFGGDRSPAGTINAWPTERGFLNKTKDSSTGLTHLGAREYDSLNGRFITPDPLVDSANQQNSPYAYAANNPIAYSDPSGLSPEDAQFWDRKPAAAQKHSRAANTNRYGKPRPYSRPKASTPKAPKKKSFGGKVWGGIKKGVKDVTVGSVEAVADRWEEGINSYRDGGVLNGLGWTVEHVICLPCVAMETLDGLSESVDAAVDAIKDGDTERISETATVVVLALVTRGRAPKGSHAGAGKKSPTSCVNSFAAGTLVLMADGTTKPIEDIEVGDRVAAADEYTGELEGPRPVTVLFATDHDDDLVDVGIREQGMAPRTIQTTADHPFWDSTLSRWVRAANLDVGHDLLTAEGASVRVQDVSARSGKAVMFNLTVRDLHTYYVMAGTTPVLVHNNNSDGFPDRELPRTPGGHPMPDPDAVGSEHTQLGTKSGRRGSYSQAREFDAHGRPVRDIDFTDHGRPADHANPHEHPYLENQTGGSRVRGKAQPMRGC